MKIGKIKSCCKKRSQVFLYNREDGSQLISDGVAFWPVDGGLRLTETALRMVFDVTEKAWHDSWVHAEINLRDGMDLDTLGSVEPHLVDEVWEAAAEVQMDPIRDGVVLYQGIELATFAADDGTQVYVPREQLRTMDENAQYYMLRSVGTHRVLAVYDSMLIAGMVTVLNGEMAREINEAIAKIIRGRFA